MKRLAALAAMKLSLYAKGRVDDAFFARYSRLISPDVTPEELASCPQDPDALFFDAPVSAVRYQKLTELCADDPIALTAIQLSLLIEMDERTLSLLRELFGQTAGALTIEIAARIACPGLESIDSIPRLRRAFERAELLLQASPDAPGFLKAPFACDGRLAAWLTGDDRPDYTLRRFCTLFKPDSGPSSSFCRMRGETERAAELLSRGQGLSFLQVAGEKTSGRRFFVRETARLLGHAVLFVPYDAISENGRLLAGPWRRVLRELLLTDRLLCLHSIDREGEDRSRVIPAQLRILERDLAPFGRPVFLTTGENVRVIPFVSCFVHFVPIRPCTPRESEELWRALALDRLASDEGFPARELAGKMNLTAGQIARILDLLARTQPEGPWDAKDIFRLCYQVLDDGRYQNIRFVEKVFRWEDLELEPYQKETLQAICAQVEHQSQVLDDWDLRGKYPYGRCVSALFSGPPGTGKTMAAQVLASRLGLELYKIDLSQVVDKYIGETEKRLREVFDRAEKSNMILFFDEADALLGKRSEVKDAKDKYANTEVAYLLQRMEEYSGVVLMATNLAANIDSAFVRRFRYHVSFTLPDRALRLRLWRAALPDTIPQKGIQFDYLAGRFELPGSQIKNIALNACYRAADDGGVLTMRHLVEAIFLERQKEGKVMLAGEFGEYGPLLYDLLERRKPRPEE